MQYTRFVSVSFVLAVAFGCGAPDEREPPIDDDAGLDAGVDAHVDVDAHVEVDAGQGVDAAVSCPADTVCTSWSVVDGVCAPTYADGVLCDDGRACSSTSACSAGVCVATATTCQNGGVCAANGACLCPDAYGGRTCADDVDECASLPSPCGFGSTCTNTVGGYTCACLAYYSTPSGGTNCSTPAAAPLAIELVFFYDETFALEFGDGATAKLESYFRLTKTLIEGAFTNPQITLSLEAIAPISAAGNVTWRRCNTATPSQPQCMGCYENMVQPHCANPISYSPIEIDDGDLLDSLASLVSTRHAALTTAIGSFDHAALFTMHDFAHNHLELAKTHSMCTHTAASVHSVRRGDPTSFAPLLLAHALGHSFGMPHDAAGAPYIMASSTSANMTATTYSPTSLSTLTTFLAAPQNTCLNDSAQSAWATTRCGDGRLDPGEQCDPGARIDTCCGPTCALVDGCACANTDPCCESGAFRPAGTTCRAALDACDAAETCTGLEGACPHDEIAAVGTACGVGGSCFRGRCALTRSELCVVRAAALGAFDIVGECTMPLSTSCTNLACRYPGGNCGTIATPPTDGTPCGGTNVCLGGTCVARAAATRYRWSVGEYGGCVDGLATRLVACVDEAGASALEAACASTMPATTRACP